MATVTKKAANELLSAGIINQKQYDAMISEGFVSEGRRAGKVRVFEGTTIQPSFYLKGSKGAELPAKAVELRTAVNALIEEYTVEQA